MLFDARIVTKAASVFGNDEAFSVLYLANIAGIDIINTEVTCYKIAMPGLILMLILTMILFSIAITCDHRLPIERKGERKTGRK